MFHGAIEKNNSGMFYGPRYIVRNTVFSIAHLPLAKTKNI